MNTVNKPARDLKVGDIMIDAVDGNVYRDTVVKNEPSLGLCNITFRGEDGDIGSATLMPTVNVTVDTSA